MHTRRNKQRIPQDAPKGPTSQPMIEEKEKEKEDEDDDELEIEVEVEAIRKDVECPICLGIIRNTRAVMECMHRFCKECIEKSFRLGNNECPACRTHCSSRRSLREDRNFDTLISIIFPNIDEYEEEEMTFSDEAKNNIKTMQEAYGKTLERQSDALGKKPASGATRSKDRYLRSSNQMVRRSQRNANAYGESSSNRRVLPTIAEEKEILSEINDLEIEAPSDDASKGEAETPQQVTNATSVGDGKSQGIICSADKFVWGRCGQRSHTGSNARHAATLRSNRLARFIDHLQNSYQNDTELDIFIKLISFEEERVPNLPRPFLNCKPTLTIKELCQYVAHETLLQTEEIELYIVKGCDPDFISEDGKLDPDKHTTQFLGRENATLADIITNNLSFGHLVIAYKRKKWNLNEVLSCSGSE